MSRSSIARAPLEPASSERDSGSASADLCSVAGEGASRLAVIEVVPTLETGAADSGAVDAVRALARYGHHVVTVSQGGRRENDVMEPGCEFIRRNVASKNPLVILRNAAFLMRLIRKHRCNVVHAHGRSAAWSAYIASRLTRVPLLTSWYKGFREQNVFKHLYNSVMARGERVIAVGEQMAELINDRHHAAWNRVVVLPASVDVEVFDPQRVSQDRVDAIRREWGVKPDTKVILVVGRMVRRKGHHVVIDAISRLKARGLKDFVCVFIGEDEGRSRYVGELWDIVLARGTAEIVRLPAAADDLAAAYAAATVAVSAAVQPEGVQRAILEAQAMRVPVVVSDLGAGPEVVLSPPTVAEDRMTGLRVPAGDDAALAAALIRLFSLPESAREAIGVRGRAWVAAHFNAATIADQTLALYAEVARSKRT